MKDKWINDIHDKMADYRKAVPESLLDEVKQEMARRNVMPGTKPVASEKRSFTVALWQRAAAAAALIAIVSVAAWLAFNDDTTRTLEVAHHQETTKEQQQETRNIPADELDVSQPVASEILSTGKPTAHENSLLAQAREAVTSLSINEASEAQKPKEIATETQTPEEGNVTLKSAPERNVTSRSNSHQRQGYVSFPREKRDKGLLALSGYVSGGMGNNSGIRQSAYYAAGSLSNGAANDASVPILYATRDNELLAATESFSRAKHHQPIKVGLSIRIPISHKWSITTGVNYSYLTSDFSEGTTQNSTETTQKLHYVGVPINANYSIYRTNRLNLYASAGGEVAKLVSGKQDISNQVNQNSVNSQRENVKENRPQLSANLSVGAEYRLIEQLNLFVEPGGSYYFDNGSGVENIYKEKPFNFSLQVGFRWELR